VLQNEIRPLADWRIRQYHDFIVKHRQKRREPIVFGNRVVKAMSPLWIGAIDFRPRRSKEYSLVIAIGGD
jgi:hypothetical protein